MPQYLQKVQTMMPEPFVLLLGDKSNSSQVNGEAVEHQSSLTAVPQAMFLSLEILVDGGVSDAWQCPAIKFLRTSINANPAV